jgi:hypothetical protein
MFCSQAGAQSYDIVGSYTIDADGGAYDPGVNDNFLSFTEASDTLSSRGVGGAVTINVADGIYDETCEFNAILGASAVNMITFQSASLDSSKVYINYSGFSSNNYAIFEVIGASYLTFKHLGFDTTDGDTYYGMAIWIKGGANHIYVENCNFIGKSTGISSSNDRRALIFGWLEDIEYLEFRNNRFTFGEDGIKLSGSLGANGMIIENNLFFDQLESPIYLREFDAPIVRNNYISNKLYVRKIGIQLELVDKGFEISGNTITQDDCYAGIYIKDCDGNPGDQGKVFNNFVTNINRGGSSNHGIWVRNTTNVKFYHNSVNLYSGWVETSSCFFQEVGGSALDIQNNSFQNSSAGYAIYITNASAISKVDYNNYFTVGNFLGHWGSSDKITLSDIVAASDDDASSISSHPWYFESEDLHTTNFRLESKGADLFADVPIDIDGEARSTTPDIGADEFTGVGEVLSGEYFVGGTDPDYATVYDASIAVNQFGVSGPTIFSIREEGFPLVTTLRLGSISGSSAINTVTFRADPANSGEVIIAHDGSSGGNQTVHLVRSSNVILDGLTISADNSTSSTVLRFNGYCEGIIIQNCTLNSQGTSSNNAAVRSVGDLLKNIQFLGNTFTGGTRGFDIDGLDVTSLKHTGIVISGNDLSGHYLAGIYLRDCIAPIITDNSITPASNNYNYNGIILEGCHNNYQILRNKVVFSSDDYGIRVYNCSGSSTFTGKIINNYVELESGADPVIGIYTHNTSFVDVYFNTSKIFSGNTHTGSHAYANTAGSNIKVKNNNFINFGAGRAYWNDNVNSIDESDYNNILSGGTILSHWGSNDQNNLDEFLLANGMDEHSLNVNPWFLDSGDPTINSSFVDGKGNAITGITTDFFDMARSDPPDIGAVEFTSTHPALEAGTYTIGGDSPNYATVVEAFTDLKLRGVSGPVIMAIRSGEYDEHIGEVEKIPGVSAENTVTVTSETGNPEDVKIYKVTDNTGGPHNIIYLKGVSHFTLRDITISSLGPVAGRPIRVGGTYSNVNLINNIFTSSNSTSYCVHFGGIFNNVKLENNLVTGGWGGIYFGGELDNYGTSNFLIGNTVTGGAYVGAKIKYQYAPQIIGNIIENTVRSGYEALVCELCADEIVISGNRIDNNNSDYGISLLNCDASNQFYGLVTNNIVRVGGTSTANGIYLDNCDYIHLYNNSVNITSTSASYGNAINIRNNNTEIEVINNVLANTGGGYALLIAEIGDVVALDYNDLYTSGINLAYANNTNYTDLASWQDASSMEEHSISSDPLFYTEADLHSMQLDFHQRGFPLTDVTHDIDSIPRDATKPDLGAVEFSCEIPNFTVYVSEPCVGDTTIIIDSTMNIAPGSTRGWDMTGDLVPDVYTTAPLEEIKWLFEESGAHSLTYSVDQIAGCRDDTTLDVFVTPEPELEITSSGAYCGAEDGTASVSVTNLTGSFDYYWSNGSRDSIATDLGLGTYSIAVSSKNGCVSTEEVSIGEAIEITFSNLSPSTCGEADGSATVSAIGGAEPYTYVWSDGRTEVTNDSLAPGPVYVDVIDDEGCYTKGFINVESVGGPQITLTNLNNNVCYGEQLGNIDLTVSGGYEPYDILWTTGEITEDIDLLAAGIYNVVIEDTSGCQAAGSFQVSQPALINVSPLITPAACEGSDGQATAVVSGGIKPYTYLWSTDAVSPTIDSLAAGVYSVTVTDDNGCLIEEPVVVSNIDAPDVTITDVTGVGCVTTDNGSITAVASPPNSFYSYSWSNGGTTPSISGLTEGTYVLTVTDEAECVGVAQAEIEQEAPAPNQICLVTVDSTGKNMILWDKISTLDVSHYNVYSERTAKGEYQLIGSVDASELGLYVDSVADPYIRSWSYKISVVDVCGNESELSDHHKTMHLTMVTDILSSTVLRWDHYEGFDISTYNIWRYDAVSGWVELARVPSGLTSYTDENPPDEDLIYYIEVEAPGPCITTLKKPTSINVSRSNRKSSKKAASSGGGGGTGFSVATMNVGNLHIYPNPASGIYNMVFDMNQEDDMTIRVYDVLGKQIEELEYKGIQGRFEKQIDLSEYSDGIYHLHIRTNNTLLHRILIKEN